MGGFYFLSLIYHILFENESWGENIFKIYALCLHTPN